MITPEFFEKQENGKITKLYMQLQIDIIQKLIKDLEDADIDITINESKFKTLVELNSKNIFEQVIEMQENISNERKQELIKMYSNMEKENLVEYKTLYEYRKKEYKASETQIRLLNAGIKQTEKVFENLNFQIAESAKIALAEALQQTYLDVVSGGLTIGEATQKYSRKLGGSGLLIQDKNGRNYKLDNVIRYNIRRNLKQTANGINRDIEEELECDGYEVTAHLGARPSHAKWQGKQYATKEEDAKKYNVDYWGKVVESEMGNQPIKDLWNDPNCRHTYSGIILGVSSKVYTDEELEKMEKATVKFKGETLTEYEALQKQHIFERKIRDIKREIESYKNTNVDYVDLNTKLKKYNEMYKDFNKETGLTASSHLTKI